MEKCYLLILMINVFQKKELERVMQEILLIHDSLSFVVDEITFAANKRTPRLYSLI